MIKLLRHAVLTGTILLAGTVSSFAQESPIPKPFNQRPAILENVGIDEKLGKKIDLSLPFKNEKGESVTLGQYFTGKKPVIISPVYFECPRLCNFHLNGLVDALKGVDWNAGDKYEVLAISFDSNEKPDVASLKKDSYMKVYDRVGSEKGFHFLTGGEDSVQMLMSEVGFKFRWNEEMKEWAHASAAILVSPDGTITRYLPGIVFEPKDVRMAIVEAGKGQIGTFVDQLVLYCFHYDPREGRFTILASNVMKLGGGAMTLALGLWLLPFWLRNRRRRGEPEARS